MPSLIHDLLFIFLKLIILVFIALPSLFWFNRLLTRLFILKYPNIGHRDRFTSPLTVAYRLIYKFFFTEQSLSLGKRRLFGLFLLVTALTIYSFDLEHILFGRKIELANIIEPGSFLLLLFIIHCWISLKVSSDFDLGESVLQKLSTATFRIPVGLFITLFLTLGSIALANKTLTRLPYDSRWTLVLSTICPMIACPLFAGCALLYRFYLDHAYFKCSNSYRNKNDLYLVEYGFHLWNLLVILWLLQVVFERSRIIDFMNWLQTVGALSASESLKETISRITAPFLFTSLFLLFYFMFFTMVHTVPKLRMEKIERLNWKYLLSVALILLGANVSLYTGVS